MILRGKERRVRIWKNMNLNCSTGKKEKLTVKVKKKGKEMEREGNGRMKIMAVITGRLQYSPPAISHNTLYIGNKKTRSGMYRSGQYCGSEFDF